MGEFFEKLEGKVPEGLEDTMREKEKEFKHWVVGTIIVNIIIIFISIVCYIYGFLWTVPWISLVLGIAGAVIVGLANLSSAKEIMGYSVSPTGFNPYKVDMLSAAKLYSAVGTICIIVSLLLTNLASVLSNLK